ncbi:two component transcriptional regulator, LytTR family [Pustulibacterium marinum]|uniref:Two component transcriptional regulator, LytTR family n=1 Tax=Pustulibacterium marinum TaxID=1224947 RepID=A0A1I7EVZ2_9FLAO|nr:LytTR family DNA-binding domain-containing protein [Pustulibacterium marinum]SFU28081.1 two component transcriptional regulator, LytTR family [Pustulibacterium marinum]
MTFLVVDDERSARKLLYTFLKEHFTESTIYEADTLKAAVNLLKEKTIDVVFLDIEMPEENGLEIIRYFEPSSIQFEIIFTTAYHQFAIDAFKLNAIDYLLKPIDEDELIKATHKALEKQAQHKIGAKIENLKKALQQLSVSKIALEVPKGILFMELEDIIYFEADGMYTNVHLKNNETKLVCKPLKFFTDQLESKPMFFKCHRSYLINLHFVKELVKNEGDYLILQNQTHIPIAKSKKEQLLTVIKDIFL